VAHPARRRGKLFPGKRTQDAGKTLARLLTFRPVYANGESVVRPSSHHVLAPKALKEPASEAAEHDVAESVSFRLAHLVELVDNYEHERKWVVPARGES
jgi:hypothetical protein